MTFSISAKIQDGSKNLVHKISAFLHFTQKFKMAAKNGYKVIFVKCCQYPLQIPCGLKISSKSLYLEPFQYKCVFVFYAEIQDGRQKWRESDFCEKSPVDSADSLQVRNFVKITLSRTVSQINVFCMLCRNSRWPPKNGGKVIFAKCHQYSPQIPCGSKILSKSLYLAPFPR